MTPKFLLNALPIVAIATILTVTGWQHWQRVQAARPDYDDPQAIASSRLAPEPGQSEVWTLVSVTDGDTIRVKQGNREERIRLCGIDAPEVAHDGQPGQPLGEQSKAYLQQLIEQGGGQVVLNPLERDRYNRIIAEVVILQANSTELFLQAELLMAGLAYVYPRYVGDCPNGEVMQKAEAIGKRERVGVWAEDYQRPWEQ